MSCHDSVVVEAFHALMGAACELGLGLGVRAAADDVESARQAVGTGAYGVPHNDMPEVLELAREFFREARSSIDFIATWRLACSSANGTVKGPRLREIVAAARPALLAAGDRLQIRQRLDAIDRRRNAERARQRAAAPKVDIETLCN